MKELSISAHPFDKYLFSLLELLRTKYFNVSVNRGSKTYTFFYSDSEGSHQFTLGLADIGVSYIYAEIPKEIKYLVENEGLFS